MLIHVVKNTDTLWGIASLYKVLPKQILKMNELSNSSKLLIGRALIIPTRKKYHITQPGENMFRIAHFYGVSLHKLLQMNQIYTPNYTYPGMKITIPVHKPFVDVNIFTNTAGEPAGNAVLEVGDGITYVSPFAYVIKEDGGIKQVNDNEILTSAANKHVSPMMCITNFTLKDTGSKLAHIILSNKSIQYRLLSNIVDIMKSKGYRGLNIHFNNVFPNDRESYNQFLQRAVSRLHQEGYYVSTTLAPKKNAKQKGILYEAHDYDVHGKIVDFVILMTYEWGDSLGTPQANSPLNQIEKVLDYAVSVIPRHKILMGMQLYARDWKLPHVQGQQAETFSMKEAISRAERYQVAIQYNQIAQSPFYRYIDQKGEHHEVWFEDARSTQAKFAFVKRYGLKGISYWVLGYPFFQNWSLLQANFNIRKIR
ncbi:glycosyl hydrolase family 18 protein [Bacillus cereus]